MRCRRLFTLFVDLHGLNVCWYISYVCIILILYTPLMVYMSVDFLACWSFLAWESVQACDAALERIMLTLICWLSHVSFLLLLSVLPCLLVGRFFLFPQFLHVTKEYIEIEWEREKERESCDWRRLNFVVQHEQNLMVSFFTGFLFVCTASVRMSEQEKSMYRRWISNVIGCMFARFIIYIYFVRIANAMNVRGQFVVWPHRRQQQPVLSAVNTSIMMIIVDGFSCCSTVWRTILWNCLYTLMGRRSVRF